MLLFMFFVCARSSAHGVLHAFDVGTDLLRCGSAVLLQQLDDGRADDGTIGDACHLCGLLRGGDAKTDGAGRLGVLPHHLYNGGKVGFDLTAGAGDAKAGHDIQKARRFCRRSVKEKRPGQKKPSSVKDE